MLERFSSSGLSVREIMLFASSYYPETVLTFCPSTWESCLNHVIAVAYRFVVELNVVYRVLQHAPSNFLIGSQVSLKEGFWGALLRM